MQWPASTVFSNRTFSYTLTPKNGLKSFMKEHFYTIVHLHFQKIFQSTPVCLFYVLTRRFSKFSKIFQVLFLQIQLLKKKVLLKTKRGKYSQIILRSNVLHHHLYLPEVDIPVQNDHWVLSRLVSCLKCTVQACSVLHGHFGLVNYLR